MLYEIEFAPRAIKDLSSIPRKDQLRIHDKIDALAAAPRPSGVKKLHGEYNLYRIRVGNWRIIYQIEDKKVLILILKIGHRKEIYR